MVLGVRTVRADVPRGHAREFTVSVDRDKRVGASFIEAAAVKDLIVTHDVVFAKPGVKSLKYDVYAPKGARNLPVIVIIHGGGWVANNEDIMRGLARELTRGSKFVVASIDYRWAGKGDGDAIGNTMANLIEDVFGGIAHIMEHAVKDPLIRDEMVKEFTDALVQAGQRVEYVQVGGAGHAFFDWKPDDRTKATFVQYGVYHAASMKKFFESTLYP